MRNLDYEEQVVGRDYLEAVRTPEELYEGYLSNKETFLETFKGLCEHKESKYALRILQSEFEIELDRKKLEKFMDILKGNVKNVSLDIFIAFFLSKYSRFKSGSFQLMLLCKSVSELVTNGGKFPSRSGSIMHFRAIAGLFMVSQSWYNYLNALYVLKKLEAGSIIKEEIVFLLKCVQIREEAFCKDLFCGQKPKEISFLDKELSTSAISGEYTEDSNWKRLVSEKNSPFDENYVLFLELNNIQYSITDNIITVGSYKPVGITKAVYSIIAKYEKRLEIKPTAYESTYLSPVLPSNKQTPTKPEVKKKSSFVVFEMRAKKGVKNFRKIYCRIKREFRDDHYKERLENDMKIIQAETDKLEEKKNFLKSKKLGVEELVAIMKQKIDEAKDQSIQTKSTQSVASSQEGVVYRPPTSVYSAVRSFSKSSSSRFGSQNSFYKKKSIFENDKRQRDSDSAEGRRFLFSKENSFYKRRENK